MLCLSPSWSWLISFSKHNLLWSTLIWVTKCSGDYDQIRVGGIMLEMQLSKNIAWKTGNCCPMVDSNNMNRGVVSVPRWLKILPWLTWVGTFEDLIDTILYLSPFGAQCTSDLVAIMQEMILKDPGSLLADINLLNTISMVWLTRAVFKWVLP